MYSNRHTTVNLVNLEFGNVGVGEAIQPYEPSTQTLVPKQIVFATIIFELVGSYAALGNEMYQSSYVGRFYSC